MDSDTRRSPRKLTLAKRRELEVAAAVARDEVMQYHISSALRLIELAAGRVSAKRMVAIYIRLHGIHGALAELLTYSVLAAIGQRATHGSTTSLVVEGEDSVPHDARALLRVMRGRLRGRVHHELRRAVELAMGAAQIGVLDIHVYHALRFARELAETHDISHAVEVYSSMTEVPVATRPMLYALVLDRLATEELPVYDATQAVAPQRVMPIGRSKSRKAV
jgi:hypothetical protein